MEVTKKYKVCVIDPPWRYRNFSDKKHGAVKAHYETMTQEALVKIPVNDWLADDAIVAMWGCWPHIDQAVKLCEEWGLRGVTGFPWLKNQPKTGEIYTGIGFWVQSCSEYILIRRKGDLKRVAKNSVNLGLLVGEDRQFYAPRTRHSKKPEGIQDWLQADFEGPYLELFATREREGWDTWGVDTGYTLGEYGVREVEKVPLAAAVHTSSPIGYEGLDAGYTN